jgi:hypothetical protein
MMTIMMMMEYLVSDRMVKGDPKSLVRAFPISPVSRRLSKFFERTKGISHFK